MFGNNTTTFGSTAKPGGFSFGQNNASTPTSTPSQGLFGKSAPANNSQFVSNTSTPTPATGFAGNVLGNNAGATNAANNGLFGSNNASGQASGGLFGNNAAPAPATSGGLFAKPATGGLFGNNAAPANGGLFGNSSTAPAAPAPANGGLFAKPAAPAAAPTTGGLFGNTTAPATGGLFGNSSTAPAAPANGGLFGNNTTAAAPANGGLFGAKPAAPASTGLFGAKPAAPASTGLFGNTTAPASTGLFGNTTAPADIATTIANMPKALTVKKTEKKRTFSVSSAIKNMIPSQPSFFSKLPKSNPSKQLSLAKDTCVSKVSDIRKLKIDPERSAAKKMKLLSGATATKLKTLDEEPPKHKEPESKPVAVATDYWCSPTFEQLSQLSFQELQTVQNFIIGRQGFGSISFDFPVDLSSFVGDFGQLFGNIVKFKNNNTVEVYPDEATKPNMGAGINVPATISLEKVFSKQETADFIKRLKSFKDMEFVSYDPYTGIWTFKVKHFSVWGLVDEEEPPRKVAQPNGWLVHVPQEVDSDDEIEEKQYEPEIEMEDFNGLEAEPDLQISHDWSKQLEICRDSGVFVKPKTLPPPPPLEEDPQCNVMCIERVNTELQDAFQKHMAKTDFSLRSNGYPLAQSKLTFSDLALLYPVESRMWELASILYEKNNDGLNEWLRQEVASLVPVDNVADSLEKIYKLLLRHDLEEAMQLSISSKNGHLAVLITLLGTPAVMDSAQRQLQEWQMLQLPVDPTVVKIYQLLSGAPHTTGLNWKVDLAVRVWYSTQGLDSAPLEDDPIADILARKSDDLRVQWYLTPNDELTVELARYLESENCHEEALFVCTFLQNDALAKSNIDKLVADRQFSHAFIKKLRVPERVFYHSRAEFFSSAPRSKAENLLLGEFFDEARVVLLERVAPELVIAQDLHTLKTMLDKFPTLGKLQVYSDYIALVEQPSQSLVAALMESLQGLPSTLESRISGSIMSVAVFKAAETKDKRMLKLPFGKSERQYVEACIKTAS